MKSEEKYLIYKLFKQLKKIEKINNVRDKDAEKIIYNFIQEQKTAPYYMTQSILLQESVINQLQEKIIKLEKKINEIKINNNKKNFLSNFFKKNKIDSSNESEFINSEHNSFILKKKNPIIRKGLGFMSGALQTAAGVAGGFFLGNFLTKVFSNLNSQEKSNLSDDNFLSELSENNDFLKKDFKLNNLDILNYGENHNNDISDEPFSDNYLDDNYLDDNYLDDNDD
ncbi:DUF2076 domain-containing protein [Sodalis-like secondary symbiont of Drepanosiphum platanoidis]|uniref:DUF2076 domain-containing protein n=1 Tax=Sodalis-like secondary symbiont of Drepanosiphum platanoidis TaxID=2994493 RepID=UPI00346388E0